MDRDRLATFGSTLAIFAALAALGFRSFGVVAVGELVLAVLGFTVLFGIPVTYFVVYVREGETYLFGPWDPEDLVFTLAVIPGVVLTAWVADAYLAGATYWAVVAVGIVASVAIAVVVRDATVGEWPPGPEREDDDSPGEGGADAPWEQ